jgi:hypothetical protein
MLACGSSKDLVSGQGPSTMSDGGLIDAALTTMDNDGDGIDDARDNCARASNRDQNDRDRDGRGDVCDNCLTVSNDDQVDADRNGVGDVCEGDGGSVVVDSDGDGVDSRVDNCRNSANPDQRDSDRDRFGDVCDNCPTIANQDQRDSDGDGLGDRCAALLPDRDGDGTRDYQDNCRAAANVDQADGDGDGVGDACDNCPILGNASQIDKDADGKGDRCDDALADEATCASGTTQANPLKPNLYFLLDRSLSMGPLPFGTEPPLRIDTLKSGLNTLAGTAAMPGAVVSNFNLGVGAFPSASGSCGADMLPQQLLPMAERAAGEGASAFTASYAQVEPAGSTPTDVALARVREQRLFELPGDAATGRSRAVVLITDGVPNDCTTDQPNRLDQTVAAAESLATMGVPLFVLGFAGVNPDAMQRIADAGDPAPGTNPWYPISDTASIVTALQNIITRTASCTLPLTATGRGASDQDVATVELVGANGASRSPVAADPLNGYSLMGGDAVVLHGEACAALQRALASDATARVEVRLGCACEASEELCGDDLDNDCDGRIDEDCIPENECGVDAPPADCEAMSGM